MNQEDLPTAQERLITALLTEKTITKACKEAGITPPTYYEWLKEPVFKEKLKAETNKVFFEARQKIKRASCRAVDVLETLLNSKEPNQRRLASLAILDFAFKDSAEDFNERLKSIEEIIIRRKIQKG